MKTMYDQWLENEKAQIRAKYDAERDAIHDKAFRDGFNQNTLYNTGTKPSNADMGSKLADIDKREEAEVDTFMRTIDKNWDSHVESVMEQK